MKHIFARMAAPLAVTMVVGSAAHAQVQSNCRFEVPPEIDLMEYMTRRHSDGENLSSDMIDMRPSYLRFQSDDIAQLNVDAATGEVALQVDMGSIVGDTHTIKRYERPNEELTVDDSYLDGSTITLYPEYGFVHITTATGENEALQLKPSDPNADDTRYLESSGSFKTLPVRVFVENVVNEYIVMRIYAEDSYVWFGFHGDHVSATYGNHIDFSSSHDSFGMPTTVSCGTAVDTTEFPWNPQGFMSGVQMK